MKHDELGAGKVAQHVRFVADVGNGLENPAPRCLVAVVLPLQVLQQLAQILVGVVAILVAQPVDIGGYLIVAVHDPGAERGFQQVDFLLRLQRFGVVRLADHGVLAGAPTEELGGAFDAGVFAVRAGVGEGRKVVALPHEHADEIAALPQHAVQLGGAGAGHAEHHQRRQDFLVENFRVFFQVILKAQAVDEQAQEALAGLVPALGAEVGFGVDGIHHLAEGDEKAQVLAVVFEACPLPGQAQEVVGTGVEFHGVVFLASGFRRQTAAG